MTTEQQLRAKIEEQHGLILALSVFLAIFVTLTLCITILFL